VQVSHLSFPTSNVPAAQASHVKRLAFLEPAAHVVHVPSLVPPQPVRIAPAAHAAHALQMFCPVSSWNTLSEALQAVIVGVPSHLEPRVQGLHSRSDVVVAAFDS